MIEVKSVKMQLFPSADKKLGIRHNTVKDVVVGGVKIEMLYQK